MNRGLTPDSLPTLPRESFNSLRHQQGTLTADVIRQLRNGLLMISYHVIHDVPD